jgi:multicomponent Na+:H+ antiporter subunit C
MNILLAAAVGGLFGAGAFLILKPDLFRVVVGMVLISNAAILALMSSGLTRGSAPIVPLEEGERVADPLVQAMTLTAVVIGLAVTALLLGLAYRVYATHRTVDLDELARAEAREEQESEREDVSV